MIIITFYACRVPPRSGESPLLYVDYERIASFYSPRGRADRCNKLRSTGLRIGQGGTPGTAFTIPHTALLPGKGADTISCGTDLPTLPSFGFGL